MTKVKVDGPAFYDLVKAARTVIINLAVDSAPATDTYEVDYATLFSLHHLVEKLHPEPAVRMHFHTSREVIDDSDI